MAPQSHPLQITAPHVLLTRPQAQSRRFARSLRAACAAPLHITISPLMQAVFFAPPLMERLPKGLIFSSETGVAAYARLPHRPIAPAWCVGQRAAKAALLAGLVPVFVAKDAAHLLARIVSIQPDGPLLHLRGEDSHGDIAHQLTTAHIPTFEAVVYAQRPVPLSTGALRLLQGHQPVVVPLFSARSATLFCAAAPSGAPVRFAALSPAVAVAISHPDATQIVVSPTPDAEAMLQTVMSLLREPSSA